MKMTFRWYGDSDPIPLEYIKQIPGCSGIMVMMDNFEAGEVWDKDVFKSLVEKVNSVGLEVEVIESINVHEDIKMGLDTRDKYIENYKKSIKNVAECGVKVIVYNFMPVFDWLKTDLGKVLFDGSNTLSYDEKDLEGLTPQQLVENTLKNANGFSLPGWEPERLQELNRVLEIYKDIDESKLLENYKYFLEGIIPTCEKYGVKMAVHPDDPAWPVFGIPRITHTPEQLEKIVNLVDSPSNTLCICTGSLGSNPNNNLPEIIREFGKRDKIGCAHVRNIKFLGDRNFYESAHLSSAGSLDMFEIMKAFHDIDFDGYIRPDHGRMIWGEKGRAGYGLYDRALGVTYLNGMWEALEKLNK
ncbi:MAG: mannonate dehydratase [Peptoniphilus sp.]|uniref:mannonate dehydratase n=1 Tax=Peptoniphilus sp. TaxID=1971214 RepID=UPI002A760B0A|nr:mannonate dehydratase [Peptoniphilus sp.]MDY2986562.1 mannonate dehydratase [Peptoniphilus sp.]